MQIFFFFLTVSRQNGLDRPTKKITSLRPCLYTYYFNYYLLRHDDQWLIIVFIIGVQI